MIGKNSSCRIASRLDTANQHYCSSGPRRISCGGVWYWGVLLPRGKEVHVPDDAITRGDLVATISTMGTVEAEAAVHIGAQVAGVIVALIISHCNFAEFAIHCSKAASGIWRLGVDSVEKL